MTLPMLPQDKANHVIYGVCIAIVGGFVAANTGITEYAPYFGIASAALFGVAKEAYDYEISKREVAAGMPPTHTADIDDFFATVAGGLLFWFAIVAVKGI